MYVTPHWIQHGIFSYNISLTVMLYYTIIFYIHIVYQMNLFNTTSMDAYEYHNSIIHHNIMLYKHKNKWFLFL